MLYAVLMYPLAYFYLRGVMFPQSYSDWGMPVFAALFIVYVDCAARAAHRTAAKETPLWAVCWMDHIDAMSELKRGIGLRGYGSVKPIDAYKQEGFDMFEAMVQGIREETVRRLFTVQVRREQPIERKAVAKNAAANVGGAPVKKKPVKKAPKPGRNDPCPCGKMKADGSRRLKYKECCGRNE